MAKKNGKAPDGDEGDAKVDVLHVALLVDESGSMTVNHPAVVGGVNEFVSQLAADQNDTKVLATLAMFDLHGNDPVVRVKYDDIPIEEVAPLGMDDYSPRGATPLNDAVVKTIRRLGKRVKKDHRAMVVILTDGLENASETTSREVRRLIAAREKRGWEFMYLGANQDVWTESERIGLAQRGKALAFDASPEGTESALRASGARAKRFRDAPAAYRAELDELDDRIEPGDTDVKRRRRPEGTVEARSEGPE